MIKRIIKKLLNKKTQLDYLIENGLKIGRECYIWSENGIDALFPFLIEIGDFVTISTNVTILAHDNSTYKQNLHTKIRRVWIGNRVFIGSGTTILPNVRVGDNVIVGANSLVSKNLSSNGVYAGNPARYICSIEDYKNKHMEGLNKHPVFKYERPFSCEQIEQIKKDLELTYGYYFK